MIKFQKILTPKRIAGILTIAVFAFSGIAQDSDSPFVNYDQFEALVKEVRQHRKERLLSMDDFNARSKKENVFILDTRSKAMYDAKHIKGAVHLNFSDFTQVNLDQLFGSRDVTILIYCNNNIEEAPLFEIEPDAEMFFATKASGPPVIQIQENIPLEELENEERGELTEPAELEEIIEEAPPITLALNIPTYINLFGYGYKNVYELKDLVSVLDPRIEFEGTAVN